MTQPDAVALINYPGHFLTTHVTIKQIDSLTSWDTPYYIMIDDCSEQYKAWPNYIENLSNSLATHFPHISFTYIKFSEFNLPDIDDGWFRQQFIKLNVDKVLPGELWYLTDGDVIVPRIIDQNEIPYFVEMDVVDDDTEFQKMTNNYRSFMLGIADTKLSQMYKGKLTEVYTNHAPFRWVTRKDLVGLREYVENQTDVMDFNVLHFALINNGDIVAGYGNDISKMIMTEWDLLEAYRSLVKKQDLKWVYTSPNEFDADPEFIEENGFKTFYGLDKDISKQWFVDQNITISDQAWSKVQNLTQTQIF